MRNIKTILLYLLFGLAVPILFLLNAFLIPEPFSHPFIYIAMSPTYLLNFFEHRALLDSLTIFMFGGQTQNDAPVLINILFIFWFFLSMILLFMLRRILRKIKKNKNSFK